MTVQDKSSSLFPLMFLQPVTDARNTWVALTLHFSPYASYNGERLLSRVFNDLRLSEALGRLFCIIRVDDIVGFDLTLAYTMRPGQIILRVPVVQCVNAALHGEFTRLNKEGFAFMADGIAPEGATMSEHVAMFAIDEHLAVQWAGKLCDPHMIECVSAPKPGNTTQSGGIGWFARLYPLDHIQQDIPQQDTVIRTRLLRLLALVSQDTNVYELEVLLKQDPVLSYQLLRLLGSAAFAFKVDITSFKQAINLLGRHQLQRWLQLLLYARPLGSDVLPNALLPRAAARAAFMEALCRERSGSRDEQDKAFLVGMFSLLDVLFGIPLVQVLQPLTLEQDITSALLEKQGELGILLTIVARAEYNADALLNEDDLEAAGITIDVYYRSLVHAYRWASRVSSEE